MIREDDKHEHPVLFKAKSEVAYVYDYGTLRQSWRQWNTINTLHPNAEQSGRICRNDHGG